MFQENQGGAFDIPDERDYIAEHILGAGPVELPKRVLLVPEGFIPDNQGRTMHCTAYGLIHNVRILKSREYKKLASADPEEQWTNQKYDRGGDENMEKVGDSLQHALSVFIGKGVYNKTPEIPEEKFNAKGYAKIGDSIADIRYWLARGFPLYSGSGGHCYDIVGYDDDLQVIYWLNSYGNNWPMKNGGGIGDDPFSESNKYFSKYILYLKTGMNHIFSDVTDQSPNADVIKWGLATGLMRGYGDSEDATQRAFMPEKPMTRVESLIIAKRLSDAFDKKLADAINSLKK